MELFKLFGTLGLNGVSETNRDIDDTVDNAEGGSNKMVSAFKKIGTAVATYFAADKIIAFGKEIVNASAEVDAETSAFEQIMGNYTEQAAAKMNKIADATGMVNTRLTPYMTSMTAKFKGLGYDITDATDYASRGLNLAADAAAFWDKSLDDSMSHLNSFINGSYEGGEAIGLFANDTQMAAYAVKTGLISETKEWANLDEATKQATRLEYAENMFKASGAVGQAAKEAGQYANVQANLTEKWRQFKAQIGQPLLQNVVIPAMDKLSGIVDKLSPAFEALVKWVKENKTLLAGLAIVVGVVTTAIALQNTVQAIKAAMNATEAVSLGALIAMKIADAAATMAALAPYLLITAAIAALIAIIVLCVKHWDEIKEAAKKAWEKIKETWETVSEWFKTTVVEPIANFFTDLWNSIKEAFSTAITWIKDAFNTIKQWFIDTIVTPIAEFYEKWIAPVINKIVEIITKLVEIVVALFVGLFNLAKEKLLKVYGWLKANVIDPVVNFISQAVEKIKNFFVAIWNKLVEVFAVVSTWVYNTVITPVIQKITAFKDRLVNGAKTLWQKIKDVFAPVGTFFSSVFSKAYSAVTGAFSKISSFFTTLWSKIKNTFSNLGSSIANAISGAVKSGINGVISMIQNTINRAIGLINGAIGLINKLPGVNVSTISTLKLPRLAKGNVAYEETPAVFGEYVGARHNPEITAPQSIMAETFRGVLDERKGKTGADDAVTKKLDELIAAIKNLKLYLDSDKVVGGIAPKMDNALGDIGRMKVRGT